MGWASNAAAQVEEFGGYFRAGGGFNSSKGGMSCFQATGAGSKFRLGNECDQYFEFVLGKKVFTSPDGVDFKIHVLPAAWIPFTNGDPGMGWGSGKVSFDPAGMDLEGLKKKFKDGADTSTIAAFGYQQLYFDSSPIEGLAKATFWGGRRYYHREAIDQTDFWYWDAGNALGGGIDNINIGEKVRVGYALFIGEDSNQLKKALKHDLSIYGIPMGLDKGAIKLGFNYYQGIADDSITSYNDGFSVGLQYQQDDLLGDEGSGTNKLAVQYGMGPGVAMGANGNMNNKSADFSTFRVLDHFSITPKSMPEFGMMFSAVYEHSKTRGDDGGHAQDWVSFGARVHYGLFEHFKLELDVGEDMVFPKGGDMRSLTKITFAPVLASAKGMGARPELRLFATVAFLNEAEKIARGSDKSASANFGIQGEVWW